MSTLPTSVARTVVSGAMTTSSWSPMPLDPFFSNRPMMRNRTPLKFTCWPTGLDPLPNRPSATVWPMTATLAWFASSDSSKNRPAWSVALRISA